MKQTISLPKTYIDRLKKEKSDRELTMSEVIRRALDLYFEAKKERGNATAN